MTQGAPSGVCRGNLDLVGYVMVREDSPVPAGKWRRRVGADGSAAGHRNEERPTRDDTVRAIDAMPLALEPGETRTGGTGVRP